MPRLTIEIVAADGRAASFAFDRGPISIGSGPLNDLVLDFPFVSQAHALVQLHDDGVRYVDLGSRNRTIIGGTPAVPNIPTAVSPDADVVLGQLRLRFKRSARAAREGNADEDERPYFGSGAVHGGRAGRSEPGKTTGLPLGFSPAEFLASLETPAPVARTLSCQLNGALSRFATAAGSDANAGNAPAAPGAPSEAAFPPGPPPVRGATGAVPALRLPDVGGAINGDQGTTPPLRAGFTRVLAPGTLPGGPGRDSPASAGLRERLEALAAALPTDGDRRFLLGLVTLAEHAAETFVALKGARQALADELGVRIVGRDAAVERVSSPTELLSHLLADPAETPKRVRQLSHATSALLGVHEMAFLAALRDGVTALVEHMDPRGPAFQRSRSRLGAFSMRDYEAFYSTETEDPWQIILGEHFVRSYAGATQALDEPEEEPASVDNRPPAPAAPVDPPSVSAARPSARITFTSGPLAGSDVGLAVGEVTIGRADDNVVVVNHPSVSRYHAVIVRDAGRWTISELGSRNGVLVNGKPVASTSLGDGDQVQLGEVSFHFRIALRSR